MRAVVTAIQSMPPALLAKYPFSCEAVAELEKRFGISIRLENPDLGNCRVTASFLHRETPEEIIKVLCGINRMQYRVETNNNIVLTGEGCR